MALLAAILQSAVPPFILPVKPTALTDGCSTNAVPTAIPLLLRLENTPFGIPVLFAAFITAEATNSPVPA